MSQTKITIRKGSTLYKVLFRVFFLLCLVFPLTVLAGPKRQIVLVDDSVIIGEVVSMTGGVYTIRTENLGVLRIEDVRVKSIGDTTNQPTRGAGEEIAGITQQMTASSSVMQQILSLQSDPEFQDILRDESVMQAIHSGDLNALMSNPKIIKLMEKQSVQQINKMIQ